MFDDEYFNRFGLVIVELYGISYGICCCGVDCVFCYCVVVIDFVG